MAKGWTTIATINDMPKSNSDKVKKNEKTFDTMIRVTKKTKDIQDLKKESKDLFETKQAENENLVNAYKEKRLKSKNLIKKAKKLANK